MRICNEWTVFEARRGVLFAFTVLVVIASAFAATSVNAKELTAQQIMDRALEENAFGFKSGQAQITLTASDRSGDRRARVLDVKSKKFGERTRTLVTLTAPREVQGQAFLFVENPDNADDVWMYLPSFSVTRRIEGNQKRGAFLGTHFTYADLESRDMKEATYKRLRDEKVGAHHVYVIESVPKSSAQSDYSKVVAYVRKDDFMPLRVRFFDKSGEVEKTLFAEKIEETSTGTKYIQQMTLRAQGGGFTTISIDSLNTDLDVPDAIFNRENLGR